MTILVFCFSDCFPWNEAVAILSRPLGRHDKCSKSMNSQWIFNSDISASSEHHLSNLHTVQLRVSFTSKALHNNAFPFWQIDHSNLYSIYSSTERRGSCWPLSAHCEQHDNYRDSESGRRDCDWKRASNFDHTTNQHNFDIIFNMSEQSKIIFLWVLT